MTCRSGAVGRGRGWRGRHQMQRDVVAVADRQITAARTAVRMSYLINIPQRGDSYLKRFTGAIAGSLHTRVKELCRNAFFFTAHNRLSEHPVQVGSRRQCNYDPYSQVLDRRYSEHPKSPFLWRHQVPHHARRRPEILTFLPNHLLAGILNLSNIRRNAILHAQIILPDQNLNPHPCPCTSIPSKHVKPAHIRTSYIVCLQT